MTLYEQIKRAGSIDREKITTPVDGNRIRRVLAKEHFTLDDLPTLLAPGAEAWLEPMAQKAALLTRNHFGNVIFLFTPLYISNICENCCPYCSFARQHKIKRKHLSIDEIRRECERIKQTGLRHILVLTGESRKVMPFGKLAEALSVIKGYFSTVSIEVYPLRQEEYAELVSMGVDGLTIYQEVYNEQVYRRLHRGGPKENYPFRLDAPERACRAGMRTVAIGPLLGLYDWRMECLCTAAHMHYLQQTYPEVEFSMSFPRIRPQAGSFEPASPVSEHQLVQIITAFRLLFPHMGITVSTRESGKFRDGVLPLGVTRMSAGVSTAVGTHSDDPSTTQFEIADRRSVDEMKQDLLKRGFQPVLHDWHAMLSGG
ncbi:MAG: 2-iminoacetate synthase ThiH [Chitinispirillaceae bacterium]